MLVKEEGASWMGLKIVYKFFVPVKRVLLPISRRKDRSAKQKVTVRNVYIPYTPGLPEVKSNLMRFLFLWAYQGRCFKHS